MWKHQNKYIIIHLRTSYDNKQFIKLYNYK